MPGVKDKKSPDAWFEDTFGFVEKDTSETSLWDLTLKQFELVDDKVLLCKANDKKFHHGGFETPSLEALRRRSEEASFEAPDDFMMAGDLTFENIVAETRELYGDVENEGAVFQVSSLYNCLETNIGSGTRKEHGVSCYASHETQGPASAISCPAATVYRNYFLSEKEPIDCLSEAAKFVDNDENKYWSMNNGYCEPYVKGSITKLSNQIASDRAGFASTFMSKVQVGVHWDTEVWTGTHRVCQVLCSALPIADFKSSAGAADWEGFARIALQAAFDATLTAAVLLAAKRGSRVKVYLTPVGGGLLGNRRRWIIEALDKALTTHRKDPLDVFLYHYAAIPEDGFLDLEEGRQLDPSTPILAWKRSARKAVTVHAKRMSAALTKDASNRQMLTAAVKETTFFPDDSTASPPEQPQDEEAVYGLMRLFATYDVNGDGYLDKRTFVDMLRNIAPELCEPGMVDQLTASADANGDGVIHYAEFLAWVFDEAIVKDAFLRVSSGHI